ncbi:MAG TPA: tripartite tricarboxylate transporter substrate binding protein [Burkholderiales bacterium]|nr:tripartite tricarboxylate transporter substrate binding protein [Burkholderiales bacterium]
MTFHASLLSLLRAALAVALCAAGMAAAQDYPSRPVRLVVPFPPGGATDILGRLIAERLSAEYKQSMVVENRPGASGHVGAQQVAKAAGDGYTLLAGTIGIHAAYASYRKLGYDPAAELQPILVLGESPNIVAVPANSPYRAFGDFLADAKANPGKINYASAGPGSSIHMVTALFELLSGTRLTHVPYKGSGPALVDLIGGQIQVMFENFSSGMPHVRSGKLRVLAVTGSKRDPKLPDVPTIAEAGVPGYAATSWFTLAAPSSMPRDLVEKVNRDANRALASPEAASRLDALGVTYTANTPAEAAAFFRSETAKWSRVIEAANLRLD